MQEKNHGRLEGVCLYVCVCGDWVFIFYPFSSSLAGAGTMENWSLVPLMYPPRSVSLVRRLLCLSSPQIFHPLNKEWIPVHLSLLGSPLHANLWKYYKESILALISAHVFLFLFLDHWLVSLETVSDCYANCYKVVHIKLQPIVNIQH